MEIKLFTDPKRSLQARLFMLQALIINFFAFGQNVHEGIICAKETGAALPFVNIGGIAKGVGTVSGRDGRFSLKLNRLKKSDSIRISMIGYKSITLTAHAFEEIYSPHDTIFLEKQIIALKEVVITSKRPKEKTLGNKMSFGRCGFGGNLLGNEVGILIDPKNTSPFTLKAFMTYIENTYDDLLLRLNIYDTTDEGYPNRKITREEVIVKCDVQKGDFIIDLEKYNLVVDAPFFVSLEWIDARNKEGLFYLPCNLTVFGSPMLERLTSQADWKEESSLSLGFRVKGEY